MKKFILMQGLVLAALAALSQDALVFKGTVKCVIDNDERATRGAKNVVVVPGFVPPKAGMTGPQGYYELNTSASVKKLDGKYVMLYFVSSCRDCEVKKNVFVSEDQTKITNKNVSFLTVETVQMKASCKNAELRSLQSDSIYNAFIKLPPEDLEKVAAYNAVTATPGVLNLLTNLVTVAAVSGGDSDADTTKFFPGKISYGQFLFASAMNASPNMGFNFSPNRDLSEAVFWNPSALASSYKTSGVHLVANFKNNYKFSAYTRLTDKLVLGAGGIYTKQDQFRTTAFSALNGTVQHLRRLKEYAVYLSPSYAINDKVSVGIGAKSIWQNYNRPARILVTGTFQSPINTFIDSTINNQHFDVDVSVSYNPTRSFKIGLNAMNLAGTELATDAPPAKQKIVPVQQLRSFGLGLCYKYKQFNFGADVLVTQDDLYDVSVGVNYIPLNNVLVSGGYAFKQQSFSLGLRIKYFRLGYVNDNDLLVNQNRKGKSGILNGQLYSGLSITF